MRVPKHKIHNFLSFFHFFLGYYPEYDVTKPPYSQFNFNPVPWKKYRKIDETEVITNSVDGFYFPTPIIYRCQQKENDVSDDLAYFYPNDVFDLQLDIGTFINFYTAVPILGDLAVTNLEFPLLFLYNDRWQYEDHNRPLKIFIYSYDKPYSNDIIRTISPTIENIKLNENERGPVSLKLMRFDTPPELRSNFEHTGYGKPKKIISEHTAVIQIPYFGLLWTNIPKEKWIDYFAPWCRMPSQKTRKGHVRNNVFNSDEFHTKRIFEKPFFTSWGSKVFYHPIFSWGIMNFFQDGGTWSDRHQTYVKFEQNTNRFTPRKINFNPSEFITPQPLIFKKIRIQLVGDQAKNILQDADEAVTKFYEYSGDPNSADIVYRDYATDIFNMIYVIPPDSEGKRYTRKHFAIVEDGMRTHNFEVQIELNHHFYDGYFKLKNTRMIIRKYSKETFDYVGDLVIPITFQKMSGNKGYYFEIENLPDEFLYKFPFQIWTDYEVYMRERIEWHNGGTSESEQSVEGSTFFSVVEAPRINLEVEPVAQPQYPVCTQKYCAVPWNVQFADDDFAFELPYDSSPHFQDQYIYDFITPTANRVVFNELNESCESILHEKTSYPNFHCTFHVKKTPPEKMLFVRYLKKVYDYLNPENNGPPNFSEIAKYPNTIRYQNHIAYESNGHYYDSFFWAPGVFAFVNCVNLEFQYTAGLHMLFNFFKIKEYTLLDIIYIFRNSLDAHENPFKIYLVKNIGTIYFENCPYLFGYHNASLPFFVENENFSPFTKIKHPFFVVEIDKLINYFSKKAEQQNKNLSDLMNFTNLFYDYLPKFADNLMNLMMIQEKYKNSDKDVLFIASLFDYNIGHYQGMMPTQIETFNIYPSSADDNAYIDKTLKLYEKIY